jgi:hypothetical protein
MILEVSPMYLYFASQKGMAEHIVVDISRKYMKRGDI